MLPRHAKERQETVDSGSEAGQLGAPGTHPAITKRGGAQVGRPSSLTEGRAGAWRTDWAGSGRPSEIAMVEATDFANRDDPAECRPLNWPAVGCILIEREVSARPVIVGEVAGQDAAQVSFAEDEDVIQTLAPDRADEPLRIGILPRALRRRQDFTDAHALQALPEHVTVDGVATAEEIRWGGVVREGVHDLLDRPSGGGMLGDIEVEDAPAVMGEDDQNEEDAPASGRNGEEVDRDEVADMVGEEGSPGLRRGRAALREQAGDGALGDVDAELQEFAVNSRRTPERVRCGHFPDEGDDLGVDVRAAPGGLA